MTEPAAWAPSRSPWLRAVLIMGVLVVVITEGLGALGMIAPLPVAVCWALVLAVALVVHRRRTGRLLPEPPPSPPFGEVHPLWWAVGVSLALTFLIGLASAPNSWDAMTYHLPRIERWVEQGHLAFWPTSVDRQLWMSPWPGFLGLQLRLLTGGDQLAFLPAWFSYLGCIVLTAGLVRQLGGDTAAQAWGSFTMATIPVAIHQASAVQTDMVAGFWILAGVALVVEAWRHPDGASGWRFALILAAATALAYASKGTAALALAPWLVLLTVALLRHRGPRAVIRPLVAGVAMMLVLNLPHWTRTAGSYGSPFGASWTLEALRLNPITGGQVVGNIVANLSLHAGAPWEEWNAAVQSGVLDLHRGLLRVDPEVQYPHFDGFRVNPYSTNESYPGMAVQLFLLLGILFAISQGHRRDDIRRIAPLALVGVAGFLLLLAVIRWQPYGTRLQFVGLLWLPAVVSLVLRTVIVRTLIAALMVLTALPALMIATPRPLLGGKSVLLTTRSEQFATERPDHFGAAERTVREARSAGCSRIGLLSGADFPEYFLWAIVRREGIEVSWDFLLSRGPPSDLTVEGPPGDFCMLLVGEMPVGLPLPWLESQFRLLWATPPLALLRRAGEGVQ